METKCIQSGYTPKNGEARVLPIYQSTTFKYENSDAMGRLFDLEDSGYFYTRLQNPTNDAVAAKICDMEGGVAAMLTSSGQAANFYAIMNIAQAGDHIVCSAAVYGIRKENKYCDCDKSSLENKRPQCTKKYSSFLQDLFS